MKIKKTARLKPKKAKRTIQEAREYAESIVDTVREPLLVLNGRLKIISANRSFYTTFKVTEKETIGQYLPDLGNKEWSIPDLLHLLKEVLPKKTVVENYEVEHDFLTIGHRIMSLNTRQLRISKETARAIVITATEEEEEEEEELILLAIEDITERKKAEERAKEMQEKLVNTEKLAVLGELAGSLSHELRNPLGAIKGAIYYLTTPGIKIDKKTEEEYFDIIRRQTVIADGIINSALDFARPQELKLQKSRINKAIDESLSEIKVPENVEIEKNYKQDMEILIDAFQIKRAFYNIIINAIQAIKDKGRIKITTEKEKDSIKVVFEDNGQGIAKEDLEKIFEPLFSKKSRGVGLGLTVVKSIIERHKGSIHIESQLGKGTTVVVKLPIKKQEKIS